MCQRDCEASKVRRSWPTTDPAPWGGKKYIHLYYRLHEDDEHSLTCVGEIMYVDKLYRRAYKSSTRPGRKQAIATKL